jgi:hypothetical protein
MFSKLHSGWFAALDDWRLPTIPYVNFVAPDVETVKVTQELFVRSVRAKRLFEYHGWRQP